MVEMAGRRRVLPRAQTQSQQDYTHWQEFGLTGQSKGFIMASQSQVEQNHQAYLDRYRHLEAEHTGKYALMRDGELIEIYEDLDSGYADGAAKFGDGEFSLKEIGAEPARLGAASLV